MTDHHDPGMAGPPVREHDLADYTVAEAGASARVDGFDLARLVDAMPRLGPVLWLERRERRLPPRRASARGCGVLLNEHPALAALAHSAAVSAHSAVTPNGPREWLCFQDGSGATRAKLYLLPDTDYLAWDQMTAAGRIAPPTPTAQPWHAHRAFLRGALARLGGGWLARVRVFELRRMPWMRTLSARPPLRISLFGYELARAIAGDEGAELASPLHST
jgi:hypothetical protein